MEGIEENFWSFGIISENQFYFGEVLNGFAHGNGIYFEENKNCLFASWQCGIQKAHYHSSENYHNFENTMRKPFPVLQVEVVYADIPVIFSNLEEYKNDVKITEELIFTNCECTIGDYKLNEIRFCYNPLIGIVAKNAYILNLFKNTAYGLLFYYLNFQFSEEIFSFGYISAGYLCSVKNWLLSLPDMNNLIISCSQLLDFFTDLHDRKIVHNNINLDSIVINSDGLLYVKDFSRSLILSKNTEFIESCLTTSKDFKSPEAKNFEKYNPFKSEVYSVGLVILSLFRQKDLGRIEPAGVDEEIQALGNAFVISILRLLLDPQPQSRISMKAASLEFRKETETRIL